MTSTDRLLHLCDLLLGAAHADGRLDHREAETVRDLLCDLSAGALPPAVDERLRAFDPKTFDLRAAAAPFRTDSPDERKRLIYLVDAIHEADDELDLAENAYLKAVAAALELPDSALAGLSLDVEFDELKETFATIRKGPPPIPQRTDAVDVDLD